MAMVMVKFFPGLMPFCGKAAKRHYKGLTIDEILRMVYIRLKLHVDSKIDLERRNGPHFGGETVHIWRRTVHI